VGAPSACCFGGAEKKKGCGDDAAAAVAHVVAQVYGPSAAAAGLHGEWRGFSNVLLREAASIP
jgi:hypothetical protein